MESRAAWIRCSFGNVSSTAPERLQVVLDVDVVETPLPVLDHTTTVKSPAQRVEQNSRWSPRPHRPFPDCWSKSERRRWIVDHDVCRSRPATLPFEPTAGGAGRRSRYNLPPQGRREHSRPANSILVACGFPGLGGTVQPYRFHGLGDSADHHNLVGAEAEAARRWRRDGRSHRPWRPRANDLGGSEPVSSSAVQPANHYRWSSLYSDQPLRRTS
jgi:hypothetical protein